MHCLEEAEHLLLTLLSCENPKTFRAITTDKKFCTLLLRCITEISWNFLNSDIPLSAEKIKYFRRYKKMLQCLSRKMGVSKKMKLDLVNGNKTLIKGLLEPVLTDLKGCL